MKFQPDKFWCLNFQLKNWGGRFIFSSACVFLYNSLSLSVGDNTLVVAEKFCAREGISKTHIPQIEEFIKKNTIHVIPKTASSNSATVSHTSALVALI